MEKQQKKYSQNSPFLTHLLTSDIYSLGFSPTLSTSSSFNDKMKNSPFPNPSTNHIPSLYNSPSPIGNMNIPSAIGSPHASPRKSISNPKANANIVNPSFQSPFGAGLFSPVWKPTSFENTTGSIQTERDLDSKIPTVIRTLNYLGLDDDDYQNTPKYDHPTANSQHEDPATKIGPSVLLSGKLDPLHHPPTPPLSYDVDLNTESFYLFTSSLWVGNIDPYLTHNDLMSIFGSFGEIESIRLLPDKECAFINYMKLQDAINARNKMQGGRAGNCIVKVGFGKSEISPVYDPNYFNHSSRAIWVLDIPNNFNEFDVITLFEKFGEIESLRLYSTKRACLICFTSMESSIQALYELNGKQFELNSLKIGFAKLLNENSNIDSIVDHSNAYPSSSLNIYPTSKNYYDSGYHRNLLNDTTSTNYSLYPNFQEEPLTLPEENSYHYETSVAPLRHLGQYATASNVTKTFHSLENSHLREIKRKLEHGHISQKEFDSIFNELFSQLVELATDGFGNTVIQKLIERSSDAQRLKIIEKCAPEIISIGIHKNGTWVVQKMLECAKSSNHIQYMLSLIKPYTPLLMMDPFGNYVTQSCLKLGPHRNQFIFDTMYLKCLEIGQGKFGARAMRASLESQYANKRQQKQMALAVIQHSLILITNPNGILLIHWLIDNSDLPGRYRVLVPKLIPRIAFLANQKLAHLILIKILSQSIEPEATLQLIKEGIFKDTETIAAIMFGGSIPSIHTDSQPSFSFVPAEFGTSLLLKCLQVAPKDMVKDLALKIDKTISEYLSGPSSNRGQFFKRLYEEIENIKSLY